MTMARSSPDRCPSDSVRPLFSLAKRRQHRRRWQIGATSAGIAVVLVAVTIAAVIAVTSGLDQLADSQRSVTDTVAQFGAVAAVSAGDVAWDQHVSDGALTVALLDQQRPLMTWVPGTEPLPAANVSIPTLVSISVAGDHVVTANRAVFCTFGLTVSSPDDPVIAEDGLPGVGTYASVPRPTTAAARTCSAESAPALGWKRTDTTTMNLLEKVLSGRVDIDHSGHIRTAVPG
jgi:hypothetical protein